MVARKCQPSTKGRAHHNRYNNHTNVVRCGCGVRAVCPIGVALSQGGAEAQEPPKDAQKYILNKKCAKFIYFSAGRPTAAILGSGVPVSFPPRGVPLQHKFLATICQKMLRDNSQPLDGECYTPKPYVGYRTLRHFCTGAEVS